MLERAQKGQNLITKAVTDHLTQRTRLLKVVLWSQDAYCGACMHAWVHVHTHAHADTQIIKCKYIICKNMSLSDAGLAGREGTDRDGRRMAAGYREVDVATTQRITYPTVKTVEHSP